MNSIHDTKSRILDAAEVLFADRGVDAVSIRDITETAGVNLGAVNYHFGSKEELIAAVFERRIRPLNEERMKALEAAERKARGHPVTVEAILESLIRPALACCSRDKRGGDPFAKLFGRCLSEPDPAVEAMLRQQFEPLVERFDAAMMKSLPQLPRSEIFWRMKFTFGALHHWLLTKEKCLPPWAATTDPEEQIQKLITFAAAGFRAS